MSDTYGKMQECWVGPKTIEKYINAIGEPEDFSAGKSESVGRDL
jgi:hypothetical protein